MQNIEISVGLKNFSNVKKFVVKAERTDVFSSLPIFQAQVSCGYGLRIQLFVLDLMLRNVSCCWS